jgi:hypothetical protein
MDCSTAPHVFFGRISANKLPILPTSLFTGTKNVADVGNVAENKTFF